jgi:hypothetical protein
MHNNFTIVRILNPNVRPVHGQNNDMLLKNLKIGKNA